jgi:hypothetical protein
MTLPRSLVALALLLVQAACAPLRPTAPILPELRGEQAKCKVAASQASPLVTEWPASEKANLEAQLRTGGVAVAYSGCNLRVLPQCKLPGSYTWQHTTPAADYVEINNEDELYAKLPLGAVSLEGELKRSGKLSVQTVVSGQMRLDGFAMNGVASEGECARATHVVGAISVGAFTLNRGGSAKTKAEADVSGIGKAGGHRDRDESMVRSAGVPDSCGDSTDAAPHANCRSPVQVFLWPIPGRAGEEGPPGTVKTEFVSASANARWDVYIDDQVACTTPCAKWVDPAHPVLLRSRDDGMPFMGPDKIQLQSLQGGGPVGAGPVQLSAHATARGELVTGITFTSFGGMGVVAGIALAGAGCGGSDSGMCNGGLIALGVGAAVTAGAIWLILDSMPRADIASGIGAWLNPGSKVGLRVGPGYIFGQF